MKKRLSVILMCCFVGLGLVSFTTYVDAAADVIMDGGFCDDETSSVAVVTNNKNGNVILSCRGTTTFIVDSAVVFKNTGFCAGAFQETVVVRPAGLYSLICTFKN